MSAHQSDSTFAKDLRSFIIDLTESALHILSFRCSLIIPSKGVTATRCSNNKDAVTSTTAVTRCSTSVANHRRQQAHQFNNDQVYNTNMVNRGPARECSLSSSLRWTQQQQKTLIKEQFVDKIEEQFVDNQLISKSIRAVLNKKVIKKFIKQFINIELIEKQVLSSMPSATRV